MELDDINGGVASWEATQKNVVAEIEKLETYDMDKTGGDTVDPVEEKRLVRKLDFWYGIKYSSSTVEH